MLYKLFIMKLQTDYVEIFADGMKLFSIIKMGNDYEEELDSE